MPIFKANFSDFDLYHESAVNWDLDFRLLSKNDFSAYLNMYMSNSVQLTRTKMNGKVEQYGLTPIGYRSLVIPANPKTYFNWLHKNVNANQLLIFPKNGTLDAVSYNGFDVFVIAIKETFLYEMLENLGYLYANKLFKTGNEQYINLSQLFAEAFIKTADIFMQQAMEVQSKGIDTNNLHLDMIDTLLIPLLRYLEDSKKTIGSSPQRRRDKAVIKAIDIINNQTGKPSTISELCRLTNVSERTLEYAFLEKYKISPSEYIKANRLHKVKNALISARGKNNQISTIANQQGFWHMGQFSADFKSQFGILPSEVLNK